MPAAETSEAILLRRARFGESSYVLIWLSPEHGKIRTAARGTARKDSKLRGRLDLFYHAEVQFAAGRKSDLHALREQHASPGALRLLTFPEDSHALDGAATEGEAALAIATFLAQRC
jgi:recombinational DNA repair protein (RecF pathway)